MLNFLKYTHIYSVVFPQQKNAMSFDRILATQPALTCLRCQWILHNCALKLASAFHRLAENSQTIDYPQRQKRTEPKVGPKISNIKAQLAIIANNQKLHLDKNPSQSNFLKINSPH